MSLTVSDWVKGSLKHVLPPYYREGIVPPDSVTPIPCIGCGVLSPMKVLHIQGPDPLIIRYQCPTCRLVWHSHHEVGIGILNGYRTRADWLPFGIAPAKKELGEIRAHARLHFPTVWRSLKRIYRVPQGYLGLQDVLAMGLATVPHLSVSTSIHENIVARMIHLLLEKDVPLFCVSRSVCRALEPTPLPADMNLTDCPPLDTPHALFLFPKDAVESPSGHCPFLMISYQVPAPIRAPPMLMTWRQLG